MTQTVKPIPDGHHTLTPYVIVDDPARAIDFYKAAFGAVVVERHADPDGKIRHASIRIGDSPMMLAPAFEYGPIVAKSPLTLGGSSNHFYVYVPNVDQLYAQAVAAGAKAIDVVKDQYYGDRTGGVIDPFGHVWWLATHIKDVSAEEMSRLNAAQHG